MNSAVTSGGGRRIVSPDAEYNRAIKAKLKNENEPEVGAKCLKQKMPKIGENRRERENTGRYRMSIRKARDRE